MHAFVPMIIEPLFSIARSGPNKNRFDSFVQALVDHILKAKDAAQLLDQRESDPLTSR